MLESESSALPFGDSPISTTSDIIHEMSKDCKSFFVKNEKNIHQNFVNEPLDNTFKVRYNLINIHKKKN